MKNTTLLIIIIIGVVAIAFFVGTRVAGRFALVNGWNNSRQIVPQMYWGKAGDRGMMMMGRGDGGGFHHGGLQGQISKIDGNNVIVQLLNGASYTVAVSDETIVNKITKGTKADLQLGQNITVLGDGFWNGTQTILIQP